jgi:hypothetical protein
MSPDDSCKRSFNLPFSRAAWSFEFHGFFSLELAVFDLLPMPGFYAADVGTFLVFGDDAFEAPLARQLEELTAVCSFGTGVPEEVCGSPNPTGTKTGIRDYFRLNARLLSESISPLKSLKPFGGGGRIRTHDTR